jgi:hypothetical protein
MKDLAIAVENGREALADPIAHFLLKDGGVAPR